MSSCGVLVWMAKMVIGKLWTFFKEVFPWTRKNKLSLELIREGPRQSSD